MNPQLDALLQAKGNRVTVTYFSPASQRDPLGGSWHPLVSSPPESARAGVPSHRRCAFSSKAPPCERGRLWGTRKPVVGGIRGRRIGMNDEWSAHVPFFPVC